ncbi:MAG: GAF domain-containing sensor histidine kinase [Bacteroidota bacterium]
MKRMKIYFTVAFVLCVKVLVAQFIQLSVEDGLSQNTIYKITQDSIGLMWFATQKGIDRYDGENFSLKHSHLHVTTGVNSLESCNEGLLLLSGEKFGHLDTRTADFTPILNWHVKELVRFHNFHGHYIGVCDKEIIRMKVDSTARTKSLDSLPSRILESTSSDSLFFAVLADEVRTYGWNGYISNYESDFTNTSSAVAVNKTLFLGTQSAQLLKIDFTAESPSIDTIDLSVSQQYSISTMMVDGKNRLWIGTDGGGLLLLNLDTYQLLNHFQEDKTNPFALSSNSISDIFESSDRTIWIGTDGGGLSLYREDGFPFEGIFSGIENGRQTYTNHVWCLQKVSDSLFLVGTDNSGLIAYDLSDHSIEKITAAEQEVRQVQDLMKIDDTFFLGTNQGLYRLNYRTNSTNTLVRESRISIENRVRRCATFPESNTFWLSAVDGVGNTQNIFFEGDFSPLDTIELSMDNVINSVMHLEGERYLLASSSGLFEYTVGEDPKIIEESEGFSISSITQRDSNRLLLSIMERGVVLYDLNTKKVDTAHFSTVNNALQSDLIYETIIDQFGKIWLSTNDGIIEIIDSLRWNRYNSGLPMQEFNSGGYLVDGETLYFGGVNGLVRFKPKSIYIEEFNSPWLIEWYYPLGERKLWRHEEVIFDTWENRPSTIALRSNFRYLNLKIYTLDFRNLAPSQIRYRINDEQEWKYSESGQEIILIKEDLTGKIRLNHDIHFSLRLPDGKWSDDITVPIKIEWFKSRENILGLIAFCIGLLLLIFVFIDQLRVKNTNKIQSRINDITRLDESKDILETATTVFTNKKYFDFGAVIIYEVDYAERSIKVVASKARDEKLLHQGEEQREVSIESEDILAQVIRTGESIAVFGKKIWHKKLAQKQPLDQEIYKKNDHHKLARVFVPIIHRVNKNFDNKEEQLLSTNKAGDLPLGLVEFRSKKNNISNWLKLFPYSSYSFVRATPFGRGRKVRLDLYIDNLAQQYYPAYKRVKGEEEFKSHILDEVTLNTEDPYEFLSVALSRIQDTLGADYASIGLRKMNTPEIDLLATRSLLLGYEDAILTRQEKAGTSNDQEKPLSITNYVDREQSTYLTGNASLDKFHYPIVKDINSEIGIPIKGTNTPVGVIVLSSKSPQYFNQVHEDLIAALTKDLGSYFLRKKRYQALAQLARPYNVFGDIENEIYNPIVKVCELYFQSDYVALWDRSDRFATNRFQLSAASSEKIVDFYQKEGIEFEKEINYEEEEDMSIVQIERLDNSFSKICRSYGFKSYIAIVIRTGSYNEVFINILSKRELPAEPYFEDRSFAKQLVKKIELAIQGSRLMDSIKSISESLLADDTKETLKTIAKSAVEALNADIVSFFPYQDNQKILVKDGVIAGVTNLKPTRPDNDEADFPNFVIESSREELWITDEEEYFDALTSYLGRPVRDRNTTFWRQKNIRSVAAKQLKFNGLKLGVMIFNYCSEVVFDSSRKKFIQAFADYATLALVNRDTISLIKEEIARLEEQENIYDQLIKKHRRQKEEAQKKGEEAQALMEQMLSAAKKSSFYLILEGMNHEIKHFLLSMRFELKKLQSRDSRLSSTEKVRLDHLYTRIRKNIRNVEGILHLFNFTDHERHIFELSTIVKRVVNFFKGQQESIEFINQLDDHITLDAHPAEISMILYNLLNNAVDAILAKKAKKPDFKGKITVTTELIPKAVHITIRDNGTGIDRSMIDRIFERSISTKEEGTGIGLFFTRAIMEKEYSGNIFHDSKVGQGTSFILEFPL